MQSLVSISMRVIQRCQVSEFKGSNSLNWFLVIAVIGVSVDSSVLFYRNMKPYFKYTVPSLLIEPLEVEIWKKLTVERQSNYRKLIDELKAMNISQMSPLTQRLISLESDRWESFIRENTEPKLQRLPTIVCMTTIFKNLEEEKAANCLIIATDSGEIFFMDSQSFRILHEARVCSFRTTPDLVSSNGSYLNYFKIIVATRESSICILRKGWLEGREIVKLEKPALALCLLPIDQTIVVLSNSLMCFSKKGKTLWTLTTPSDVSCMTPVSLPHLGVSMVKCSTLQSETFLKINSTDLRGNARWIGSTLFPEVSC